MTDTTRSGEPSSRRTGTRPTDGEREETAPHSGHIHRTPEGATASCSCGWSGTDAPHEYAEVAFARHFEQVGALPDVTGDHDPDYEPLLVLARNRKGQHRLIHPIHWEPVTDGVNVYLSWSDVNHDHEATPTR